MPEDESSKALLQQMLLELYGKAAGEDAKEAHLQGGSYLVAKDKQFLGKITANKQDQASILNGFGPYGSVYSPTSIFNQYSQYGGLYGRYSPQNPYTTEPPDLFVADRFIGQVSANAYVPNRIPYEAFIFTLKNSIDALLRGQIIADEVEGRALRNDTFVVAADGTFLGSLNPNTFDTESLFNKFGTYGNRYNQLSIFNRYGTYGNAYSQLSPFNRHSRTPPKIYAGKKMIAHLSENVALRPRVSPQEVLEWARRNVRTTFI